MNQSKIVLGKASQHEYSHIVKWLDAHYQHSIGLTYFLEKTLVFDSPWQLLRLYDLVILNKLLGVAVVMAEATCFWLPEENEQASLLCAEIFKLKPKRILTSAFGRELLRRELLCRALLRKNTDDHAQIFSQIVKEYDQWLMLCPNPFPTSIGRFANFSDIPRLQEYQKLYNEERKVDELTHWEEQVEQDKVIVYDVDKKIASIVRFGIETQRLVSIGGTYTFPEYRRKGYAEKVIEFAVDRIVASSRSAHLIVDIDNFSAVELYRKIGFECVGQAYIAYLRYD